MISSVSNQYAATMYQNAINRNKHTANSNQSQFNQSVSNNLSTNNAGGSVPTFTLYKDAVLSTCNASGASVHVYNDEASGKYKVKGTDVDGKEFETLVDINDINPNNASRVEMLTLAAHLGKQDDKFPVSFLINSRREMDAYALSSPNEQKNFKWKSVFTKENQYDDLNYIAQSFYKAGAMDGYTTVSNLIRDIKFHVKQEGI